VAGLPAAPVLQEIFVTKKYVMRIDNGTCYPFETHARFADDPKYKVLDYSKDAVVEKVPDAVIAPVVETSDRMGQIIDAVKQIGPEHYGAAAGGRPAMPRVAAVVALTGFQVKADEILSAMETIKG
jgi:hypothetical protein